MNHDPIAQMLTIIRNGQQARKYQVSIPYSNHKHDILKLMHKEGFIYDFKVEGSTPQHKKIIVTLSYFEEKPVIKHIKRVSKSSCPRYTSFEKLPKLFGGMGVLIVSTPKGLMSDHDIRRHYRTSQERLGGEVIAEIA